MPNNLAIFLYKESFVTEQLLKQDSKPLAITFLPRHQWSFSLILAVSNLSTLALQTKVEPFSQHQKGYRVNGG